MEKCRIGPICNIGDLLLTLGIKMEEYRIDYRYYGGGGDSILTLRSKMVKYRGLITEVKGGNSLLSLRSKMEKYRINYRCNRGGGAFATHSWW